MEGCTANSRAKTRASRMACEAPLPPTGCMGWGRIAEQGHPPEVPGRERVAIHHRVLVHHLSLADERGHIQEVEDERRERRLRVLAAGDGGPVRWRHGPPAGGPEGRYPVEERPPL